MSTIKCHTGKFFGFHHLGNAEANEADGNQKGSRLDYGKIYKLRELGIVSVNVAFWSEKERPVHDARLTIHVNKLIIYCCELREKTSELGASIVELFYIKGRTQYNSDFWLGNKNIF